MRHGEDSSSAMHRRSYGAAPVGGTSHFRLVERIQGAIVADVELPHSGGVDSSVAALLMYKAIGARLTCVFVDQGMMRMREAERVVESRRAHGVIPRRPRVSRRTLQQPDGLVVDRGVLRQAYV